MISKLISKDKPKEDGKYPCLMTSRWDNGDEVVTLFTSKYKGTVVFSTSKYWSVGVVSDSWNITSFVPFTGTVELSNN